MGDKTMYLVRDVREARERAGISQRALSERTGQTQSHISQIESGKMEPGLPSFIDMARALGLEVMLVPTKLVPGVRELVRSQSGFDGIPDRSRSRAFSRVLRVLKGVRTKYGGSAHLDRIDALIREFRFINVNRAQARVINDEIDRIEQLDDEADAADSLRNAANLLQNLRNTIAHGVPSEPRPAYTLDD